ncbi:hypothetical protein QTG56_22605 (plasmid) [Rossellomorea sp. AcN35-11]|nr:hypothetical protein [Rossellomorea aquimaris]WJV32165.1 hypothetical protein QTG56_22605 [Rossellomorea sp. AcN35-11]
MTTTTVQRNEVKVLNVPVNKCDCNRSSMDVYPVVIIEDFIRNCKGDRNQYDYNEIKDAYEGISTKDILNKRKEEIQ